MAYIVIVRNKKEPKYFSYMVNEPNSARILRTYTAQRGCTVDCLAVSAIYKDAKHILNSKYGQVKKTLTGLQRPSAPVKMIAVIKDLVDMDLMIKDRLSKEHKRQLDAFQRAQREELPKNSGIGNRIDELTDGEGQGSPKLNDTFDSLDSVDNALLELTAESVEKSINQVQIMNSLKAVHRKLEDQDKRLKNIEAMLSKLTVNHEPTPALLSQSSYTSDGYSPPRTQGSNQMDMYSTAGPSRVLPHCLACGSEVHDKEDCILYRTHRCTVCSMMGHYEGLHTSQNKAFQYKLVKEYGWDAFHHFYA